MSKGDKPSDRAKRYAIRQWGTEAGTWSGNETRLYIRLAWMAGYRAARRRARAKGRTK